MSHIVRPSRLVPLVVALAASVVVATATPAPARTGRSSGAATNTADEQSNSTRTVVATGIARVRGVPDVLTMELGVTSRGDTVGQALDRNNSTVADVMKVLERGGVDDKDIQTSNFSIGPYFDDKSTDVAGYEVSNVLSVQLRNLGKAGSLIDDAARAGGDDVVMRGVSFGFDDTSSLVAQARAEAVKRARNQAEQLATAAGVELGEVRTISEASYDAGPVLAAPESSARAADTSVSVSPGSQELSVQVSIVYAIR